MCWSADGGFDETDAEAFDFVLVAEFLALKGEFDLVSEGGGGGEMALLGGKSKPMLDSICCAQVQLSLCACKCRL